MTRIINDISYVDRAESTATLVRVPLEGQTPLPESQVSIDARNYPLSTRNSANAYIIPVDKEQVYLNFIPQKIVINDSDILNVLAPTFNYFIDEDIPAAEPFLLADGQMFRCVSLGDPPKPKEEYTYYIMVDGVARQIPDYKTLEVMLAQRSQTLLSVRVLEDSLCADIPKDSDPGRGGVGGSAGGDGSGGSGGDGSGGGIASMSDQWSPEFTDMTSIEALRNLENNAKAASDIAAAATAQADQQIAAVKAEAEQAKAEAEAAEAKSVADAAAAAAAIATADAAKAAADAAKAQADAAKAAAEAAEAAALAAAAEAQAAAAALLNSGS